ncbi:carboxylesterase/lipase family protein [Nocardia transvalensis]|uniref:carboxylesterase/lipase family protein n=1 Tax=Nocardia transvalensis TaxID=37333 RepID=UPI0018952196|nr:carboxylesterase family protein [Nocardia transvalensis]MBF6328026.1 carboxylesterase/lipase family protein [Nocardia transvalensis]
MTTVDTSAGKVRGIVEASGVAAFRGIPFADSPVGESRFAAPQPHPGWSGVLDAVRSGPAVPQWPSRLEAVMGTRIGNWHEDGCLTLNVWMPPRDSDAPRPVLLWFHGGGFTSGSGGWDWYDGARLAALGGIVVVTANYRLGPLGYLHLPGIDNPGSQDQAAALRWVADNIAAFGGDPNSITVGGQSAGAYSAMALATDPATGGLVRRVIGQSGPWGLRPHDPEQAAQVAAKYLDILGVSDADPLARLRELPVTRLLAAYARLAVDTGRPGVLEPPMYPVLGGAGYPVAWDDAVAAGALGGKDVLLGSTVDETSAFLALNPIIQTLDREAAVAILNTRSGGEGQRRYERAATRMPEATPAQVLAAVSTDLYFESGIRRIADELAAQGGSPYVYRFTRAPQPDPYGLGATHCAELPFLFGTFDAFPNSPMLGAVGDSDQALSRAFAGAVAAFVANGVPNRTDLESWAPWGEDPTVRSF